MMYGLNAPREEQNVTQMPGNVRNRGRSVSMLGGGQKAAKSVTINEETEGSTQEEQSTERVKKQTIITSILKHK